MHTTNFSVLVPWVIAHGYFLFFIAALIEGPIITIAAGVASALGFFNIFLIIFLAILGDIGGDLFFYTLGYNSRWIMYTPFFKFIGVTEERIKKIERLLHSNIGKTVFLVKVSPFIGTPGILVIGATHTPFKKFIKVAISVAIPKTIFYSLIGFLSGQAYLSLTKVVRRTEYALLVIIVLVTLIYILNSKVTGYLARKVE